MHNPINMSNLLGNWPRWVQNIGNAVKNVINTVVKKVKTVISSIEESFSKTYLDKANSLPLKGDLKSSQTLKNPDGTPK